MTTPRKSRRQQLQDPVSAMVRDHEADSKRRAREPFATSDRTGMPPREELGRVERRAVLGIGPRRSLWSEVDALDQRIAELGARFSEATERVRELMQRRTNAPQADANRLAAWELDDRRGEKPTASTTGLDEQIADAERDRDGLQAAVDSAQEAKAAFVEANRKRLVNVAAQQADDAHARILALVDELGEARATLVDLRAAESWASVYPEPLAGGEPPTGLIARGLAEPVADTLMLNPAPQLRADAVLDLLRRDADALRRASAAQRAQLEGLDPAKRPTGGTVWSDSEEGVTQRKKDHAEAVERYRREWGVAPPW